MDVGSSAVRGIVPVVCPSNAIVDPASAHSAHSVATFSRAREVRSSRQVAFTVCSRSVPTSAMRARNWRTNVTVTANGAVAVHTAGSVVRYLSLGSIAMPSGTETTVSASTQEDQEVLAGAEDATPKSENETDAGWSAESPTSEMEAVGSTPEERVD